MVDMIYFQIVLHQNENPVDHKHYLFIQKILK